MRQQVADGDIAPCGGCVLEVTADFVLDRKFAALGQEQDAGGGELLGNGADLKRGIRAGGPGCSTAWPGSCSRLEKP